MFTTLQWTIAVYIKFLLASKITDLIDCFRKFRSYQKEYIVDIIIQNMWFSNLPSGDFVPLHIPKTDRSSKRNVF